ncbi:MAG: Serine/threonine-protein kinase AfsK [candidate division BRC1 bacterium ADurb.BinA364]|nr:MAG: Serine/threonine-protein kinase AfsK [candidate division BRC1 bacterium ADurb.BinA364]
MEIPIAMRKTIAFLITGLSILSSAAWAADSDWPQWRFDANRSAAAAMELPPAPRLLWSRDLGAPDPAFDHQMRICADSGYAPVAAGGLLFVPSNSTDSVAAYDLATGREKWRYFAEGPVRFAPIAAEGRLWFGSDDGYLYCLNAADGALVWKLRGAPENLPDSNLLANGRMSSRWAVRGAPVLHEGAVYFGAGLWPEEGVYVVAADAQNGKVLWRSDAMSHVPNGMSDHNVDYDIGLPPHGYPSVIDGRLLMASGRSPAAFFDLKTGAMEPYTTMYVKFNAPRGYWYTSGIGQYWFQGGNILGTCASILGELPPDKAPLAEFAARFGYTEDELLYPASPKNKKLQAKFGMAFQLMEENGEKYIVYRFSDPLSAGMVAPREILPNDRYFLENRPLFRVDPVHRADLHAETGVFSEPVWTSDTLYWSEFDDPAAQVVERGDTRVKTPRYDSIVARDLTNPRWVVPPPNYFREREFPVKWRLKAPYKILIKAGQRLYGGIEGEIAAIQIPAENEAPGVAWTAPVEGAPAHMLAAGGKLIVATDKGRLYCFGDSGAESAPCAPPREPPADSAWDEVAAAAIAGRQAAAGYALVLGWNSGALARAFAAREGWRVVVLEPDADAAARARSDLAESGLYGKRVHVLAKMPGAAAIAPNWADAIASENISAFRGGLKQTLDCVAQAMRPYSGIALLPLQSAEQDALAAACPKAMNYSIDEIAGRTRIRRLAPPPGAADWTHESGSPSNTYASRDSLVRAPFRLMWLSGEIDSIATPEFEYQHSRSPFPLYWRGQMFDIASNIVNSTDIYTGRFLWRYELPETEKTRALTWVHRPFSRPDDDNFLILDGRLYAVSNETCHVLDAATGRKLRTLAIPAELKSRNAKEWTEFRGADERLFSVFGNILACLNPRDGSVQWTHESAMKNLTFALGGGMAFCVDYDAPDRFGGTRKASNANLYALDSATGKEVWRGSLTVPPLPEYSVAGVQGGAVDWVAPIKPVLAYNAKHDILLSAINRAEWAAWRGADGEALWTKKIQWPAARIHHLEPPTILADYAIPHQGDYAASGNAFDIRTGEPVDLGNIVPSKRGCGRIVGNDYLLTYRDAATAIYDLEAQRILRNNAIRSGCTNAMIPAEGVLNAPNFANGCVCNYPVFASYALYHAGESPAAMPDYYALMTPRPPVRPGARQDMGAD